MVLYPEQYLTQPEALAFCRAQHGAAASLPSSAPAVMAAAQALVQEAQVRAYLTVPASPTHA